MNRINKFIISIVVVIFGLGGQVFGCLTGMDIVYCPSIPNPIYVGQTVTFTANCDNPDSIQEYKWTFPAGAYCIQGQGARNASCKFSPSGTYTVQVLFKYNNHWNGPATETLTVDSVGLCTWYVRTDGNDNNNGRVNGTGGSPNYTGAFRNIQTAIDSASDGDTIIVREGTYLEQLDMKGKSLNVHSEFPDDWAKVQNTVINADNKGAAIVFRGNESAASGAQLKGFKITGGLSDGTIQGLLGRWSLDENADDFLGNYPGTIYVDGITVPPATPSWDNGVKGQAISLNGGDAVYIEGSDDAGSPFNALTNVTLDAWVKIPPSNGGGIIVSSSRPWDTTFHLGVWGSGVVFMSRYANLQPWSMSTSAILQPNTWYHVVGVIDDDFNIAYIYVDGQLQAQSPILVERTALVNMVKIGCRNDIADYSFVGQIDEVSIYNRALSESEVFRLDMWGGIIGNGTTANISQCIITGNSGGIFQVDGNISSCYILKNEVQDADGGGLADCNGNIINCVIGGNTASNAGAMDNCDGDIINCTIVANKADMTSGLVGGIRDCGGNITNSIIWNNSDSTGTTLGAQIQGYTPGNINYSCIQGWVSGGTGNKNVSPGPAFDLTSPDWDGTDNIPGTSNDVLIPQNSQCLDSADNATLQGLIQYDIANNPRIFDRNHDFVAVADMGAYEARPAIYYVDGMASNGDGSSWLSPFKYLTDALTAAGADSEIWVRGSEIGITYYPDENAQNPAGTGVRTASFVLPQGVYLFGGFNGTEIANSQRDWTANVAILSGDIDGDGILNAANSYTVVFASGKVIDGFTITMGYANLAQLSFGGLGGGMIVSAPDISINNCRFVNNKAYYGGAICSLSSSTSIKNSLFAFNGIAVNNGVGGAIFYNDEENGTIENCTIAKNTATVSGGIGGAICCNTSSTLTIKNTIVWGNQDSCGLDDIDTFGGSFVDVSYSDVGNIYADTGTSITIGSSCMSLDPLFADAANGDFHLKSAAGRWTSGGWVTDSVTSPCINAGDPSSVYANELSPNGSRINMGAYGNAEQASKSSLYPLIIYMMTDDQAALPSDAKWYISGQSGTTYSSGQAAMVSAGSYTIKFQIGSNTPYIEPSDMTKTITTSSVNIYSRIYKAAGWIQYLCYYYDDNGNYSTNGVGWKVSSESSYHNGKYKYAVGSYAVQFQTVAEHATPANTQITLTKGAYNPYDKQYQRTTFYVDVNYGSNNNKGGSMNPFLTIQKGLNSAPSNSITSDIKNIYVDSGWSNIVENLSFPSNKTIHLHGQNVYLYGSHSCCPSTSPSGMTFIGLYLRCQ
jgi:hypothetical protein